MPTVSELQVVVNADTAPAERGLSSFSSSMGGLIGAGVVAAGAAVAAGVAVGVKAAGDLEQAVANISTIKPEIDTSAVFGALNEMSTRIPQTASQLGDSLYNVFSSMDVGTEQAIALVETFARGAVGAQTDAETFGTAIMGVLNAYKLSAEDAAHVSDVFFNTVNKGVVTGEELAASLGPVTQSAKAAGVSVDELGAMIAAVTKEGGPAAQNINNLNNFLQKITTKEAQAQLEALGVKTKTATGEFRPTADVLTDLRERLAGMTEAGRANALQAIFPDAQARIGAATLISQLDLVKSATEENTNATGVAAAAYEKMSATFNSQTKLLMNALMSILTQVGAAILPMITPLVTAFSQWLPVAFAATQAALTPLFETLSMLGKYLGAILVDGDYLNDWLTHLPVPIQGAALALGQLISAVQSLATILTSAEWDLAATSAYENLVQIFGPEATNMALQFARVVGEAFTEIATFAVEQMGIVVAWFQENWPLIQETVRVILATIALFWEEHGQNITTTVQAAWTIIKTTIAGSLDGILSTLKAAMQLITGDWQGAWETMSGLAERNAERSKSILSALWDAIVALFDLQTGNIRHKIADWLSGMADQIGQGWEAAKEATASAWEAITQAINDAVSGVGDALSSAWDTIGNTLQGAWDGFLQTIEGALDGIQTAIRTVWEQIPEDIRRDLELIATTLADRGRQWVENVTTTGADMLTAISTKLTAIVEAVTTWATSTVLEPIRGLISSATTAATEVGQGIWTSITTKLAEVVTAVTTWATSTFIAPITGLVGTATTAATNVGEGIRSAVQGKLDAIVSAITSWGSTVVSAVSGLAGAASSAASSIGQAIVDGIVGALNRGSGAIRDAAYRAARAALDAAIRIIQPGSPSKVFTKLGETIPAGLAEGIDSGLAAVSQAMAGMLPSPMVPSYAGAGAGIAGPMQTHHFIVRDPSGQTLADWYVTGREVAIRYGRATS